MFGEGRCTQTYMFLWNKGGTGYEFMHWDLQYAVSSVHTSGAIHHDIPLPGVSIAACHFVLNTIEFLGSWSF